MSYFTTMSGVLDALPALAMAYACQISTPTLWNEMYQPTRGRMLLLYLYALGGALYYTPFTVTALCYTIPLYYTRLPLRCLLHYQGTIGAMTLYLLVGGFGYFTFGSRA